MTLPRIAQRLRAIPPSGLVHFFDLLAGMEDVLSLGIGEPDLPTPEPICRAGRAALEQGKIGYTSNAGLPALRQRIAAHLARSYGVEYDPEGEILITVGVSEALHLALMAVLDPGDALLLPEPCFVAYDPCVRLVNGVPLPVATTVEHGFQVTRQQLAEAWRPGTKALLINYPNNPTGAVMGREGLLEVAQFALERDLVVISDEIYDRFVYGVEHTCFAALPQMRDRTILLGGFSKAYAMTGWRIGYACGPRDLIEAMHKAHQYIIMSAPTLGQLGALQALTCEDDCAAEIVQEFGRRREVMLQGLRSIGLPTYPSPGAIYLFPSIAPTGLSAQEFSERLLLEEKVAVVPGDAFGPSGAGFVRVAYTVPLPQIEEALERMERFLRRL
jgi:aminotransferase